MTGRERRREKSVRNNPASNKVRREGGWGGTPDDIRDSAAAQGLDHTGADIHSAAHEGLHTAAVGYFKKELQLMETPCWSTAKMRGGRRSSEVMDWLHPPFPVLHPSLHCWVGIKLLTRDNSQHHQIQICFEQWLKVCAYQFLWKIDASPLLSSNAQLK